MGVRLVRQGGTMGLNCDAHFGGSIRVTALERDVSTFPSGGGMRHRGQQHNAPAGWTPPRRVALPRAHRLCACNPPEGPSMCAQLKTQNHVNNSHSKTIHTFFITPLFARGQSQHRGQSQPWLLFSSGTTHPSCENSSQGCH